MPTVLVAPGAGDIHWVMLKLEALIERNFGGEKPTVWVWSQNASRDRSEGYVKSIPFVEWGGYFQAAAYSAVGQKMFAHGVPGQMAFLDFTIFISLNAQLARGTPIAEIFPEYDINWDYEIKLRPEDHLYGFELRPYVAVSFFEHGVYGDWIRRLGFDKIAALLAGIRENYRVVLTGREWDSSLMDRLGSAEDVNLCGKTSMEEFMGLCRHARAFIGMAAGNGMLAQHLGTETFMFWGPNPAQWVPAFEANWVDPAKLGTVYHPVSVDNPTVVDDILVTIK